MIATSWERVTTRTLEVDRGGVTDYPGTYSVYETRKREEHQSRLKAFREQQTHVRREKEFIKKHMGSQRTREAKGRRRRLDKMEFMDTPESGAAEMKISLAPRRRLGNEVIEIENLAMGYGGQALYRDLDLRIEPGDRIGIVGPNGTGKTTLLAALVGSLEPIEGTVSVGSTVEMGYYDQRHASLNLAHSPHEEIAEVDLELTDLQIRSFLARFLFRDDDVHRPIRSFSGGERGKLALAKLILRRPNLLLLDEPTNHLDIPSRKALEDALDDYGGTIVVVSHDRWFLDRLCTRVLAFDGGQTRLVNGNYSAYHLKKLDLERAEADRREQVESEARKKKPKSPPSSRSSKRRPLAKIEADIMALEDEKREVLAVLEHPDSWKDPDRLKEFRERSKALDAELAALETEWEEHI